MWNLLPALASQSRLRLYDEDFCSWIAWDLKTRWPNGPKHPDTAVLLYFRLQQNFHYNMGVTWRRHGVSWLTVYIPFLSFLKVIWQGGWTRWSPQVPLKPNYSVICSHVCCFNANILPVDVPQFMLENILVHQLEFWCIVLWFVFFLFWLFGFLLAIRKAWTLKNLC